MKKIFVQYPSFRSSTKKYDPCVVNENALKCSDCKIQIISDHFLGEEFMRKVMRGRFNYPYVLIADTTGCNMRYWFCYSWHYWTPIIALEEGCKPCARGARMIASSGGVSVDSGREGPRELIRFIKEHRKDEDFRFVVYPWKESEEANRKQIRLTEFVN